MQIKNKYILSLDASTSCTGWALFCNDNLIDYGKIKPDKKLNWRDRVKEIFEELQRIIKSHPARKITTIYIEDVPLKPQGGVKTSVQLGVVQGMILTLSYLHNIECECVSVGTWRSTMALYNKTQEGLKRENLKIASIKKANELFNLDLQCILTKNGNYNAEKSDDDIADAILLGASTIDKYKQNPNLEKGFGRKAKVDGF